MSSNSKYLLGIILITIGLSAFITRNGKQNFDHNMNVSEAITLNVRTSSGDIDIRNSESNELQIRTNVKVRSFIPFEAGRITKRIKENPPVEQNGSQITVGDLSKYRFGPSLFRFINIDYDIETPFETRLELRSSSGNQTVEDITGPVTAKASSGNITLNNIVENIEADLSSGNLTINETDGTLDISLSSGNIKLTDISGSIRSKQSSGNITLKDVKDNLDLTVSSGNINLDSDLPTGVNWTFKATSGDVELDLPNDANFKTEINVTSGNIYYGSFDFTGEETSRKTSGIIGNGTGSSTLNINTTSGDVHFN